MQIPASGADAPADSRRGAWVARSALELVIVVVWAAFVGRSYLTFDPYSLPVGVYNEFGTAVMSHSIWSNLPRCGLCVMWNGSINGGSPAFAELLGAPLHPLVIVTTLVWGTIVGGKLTVVASLAMAGLGQWWLARVMQLGRLARLWSAMLVVSAGHLSGRMEQGVVAVVVSTAACSLLLAPLLDVLLNGRRRAAVLLGITLALAIVSGQGYMQLGAVLGLGPAVLVLLVGRDANRSRVRRELALALGLAFLLAGLFVVPLGHFWPEFAKDSDPRFRSSQPLGYLLLNLVIDNAAYFRSEQLDKLPFPYLYINYIGWIPIVLAVLGVRLIPRSRIHLLWFFVVGIAGVFITASAAPFRALALLVPALAGSVRNPVLIAALAVPLIGALAAWGVDGVVKRAATSGSAWRPSMGQLLILAPLVWSLISAYSFSREWLQLAPRDQQMEPVFELLATDSAEWTATPHGLHVWIPPALEAGLKLTNVVAPWHWNDRSLPRPRRSATLEVPPVAWATFGDIYVLDDPANVYAAVRNGAIMVPCSATARGGNIDVECNADTPGVLEVQEHAWSGWYATRDGTRVALQGDEWLRVEAPEGPHRYTFRYRPWDVGLGALLSCAGVVLAARLWITAGRRGLQRP